jgi:hypothetical protein
MRLARLCGFMLAIFGGLGLRDLLALAEAIELMILPLVEMRSHGVVKVGEWSRGRL